MGFSQIINEPFDNLDDWVAPPQFVIVVGKCRATAAGPPAFMIHDTPIVQGATYRIDWILTQAAATGSGNFFVGSDSSTYDFRADGTGFHSQEVVAGFDNTTFRLFVAGPSEVIWTMDFVQVFIKTGKVSLINNQPRNTLINKAI